MPTSSSSPSGNTERTRPPGETSEARIAKALAHPLRARILQRLGERVASPGDLALELDQPLGVVSYHVRMLRDYECVELVRTEPRRGALQHFYRATARPALNGDDWRAPPPGPRPGPAGEAPQKKLPDPRAAAGARGPAPRARGRDAQEYAHRPRRGRGRRRAQRSRRGARAHAARARRARAPQARPAAGPHARAGASDRRRERRARGRADPDRARGAALPPRGLGRAVAAGFRLRPLR